MKKLDEVIDQVDEKVEQAITPFWNYFKKYFSVFSTILLILLVVFFVLRVLHNKPYFAAAVIAEDIDLIAFALQEIDTSCNILSIENERNFIDFLTVEKFVGSEVGALNLVYPNKWEGPYLGDNPTFQEKFYELVKTKDGVFIVPGFGVKLPNGFEIGKDFKITFDSSIPEMMGKDGNLNYKGQPLASKIDFEIGDWDKEKLSREEIEEISDILEEFNTAMPYTHNQTMPYQC